MVMCSVTGAACWFEYVRGTVSTLNGAGSCCISGWSISSSKTYKKFKGVLITPNYIVTAESLRLAFRFQYCILFTLPFLSACYGERETVSTTHVSLKLENECKQKEENARFKVIFGS
jgi:hypothetical protein